MKPKTNCYIRIYVPLFLFGALFSANIFAQPGNDNCVNATTLTSAISCSNNQYNLRNATASTGIPAGCATGGIHYDVWFQFTAASTTQTVTISSLQSAITNPEIQLFSGTCVSLISLICGTTTFTTTGLTIGNIYYIRVSNIGSAINNNGRFDICVTHPPAVPPNDNCSGATTLVSSSTCNNTTGNIFYATSSSPAGACGGATATTTFDVWFRFQATATSQTITLNNLGSRLTAASTYIELLSGACGGLTSLGCQAASSRLTVSGLTIGTFYYVRVYVILNPTGGQSSNWNFDICIQSPPANNDCAGAITLTPGATCINTTGTLDLATPNAAVPIGCFAAGTYYDVWYRFVATAVTHTVTLSSLGSSFTAPRIQIYSGSCAALVSIGCAAASTLTQGGLIIGQTYYVRIANFNTNPSGTGTVANFNICITAAAAPPANDLCSGAILLTSGTSCSDISGTLLNATATVGLAACGNNGSAEVWYRFVAQSSYPVITLSSIGANLNTAVPMIQLFAGVCGGLTSLACTANPLNTLTAIGGTGLTVGNTYYVRITTNTNTGIPAAGTWGFNICITDPLSAAVDYAKSYVNITDGTVGGTIDPGDILEIRATLVIMRSGAPLATKSLDSLAFYDTLRAGKGLKLVASSIALKTNEGKLYKGFTDAFDSDAGWYATAGAGTDTAIRINMGLNATNIARGKLRSNSYPSFFGNTCIIMATYRVVVNAGYGSKINFGGGAFSYRDTATGISYKINFPYDSLMVFQSPGACPNSVSPVNMLGDEFNGTFGAPSGSPVYPQNRGVSPNTNYIYSNFSANTPNDYYYGIANNTSAAGSTSQVVAKPNAARVFSVWDITGDHTGASNQAKGNLPCNLSQPISATNPCGYMLVINSSYKTDTAFKFVVTGACPSTYYEISAWFKNICSKCGCDSLGRGTGTAGYIPTAPGDSSGVRPNIAIEINGVDYYTTGDILYQGLGGTQTGSDTLNNWVQKTFVYKTDPSANSFIMTFRNNAPGGGGNDWAIDDITLKTCSPELDLIPGPNPFICDSNLVEMSTTVRSFYNNYNYYVWEKSTDGGVTWISTGVSGGPVPPAWNGTEWKYTVDYPPFIAYSSDSGSMYRVEVATTPGNLSSSTCRFSQNGEITLNVNSCDNLLSNDELILRGRNENNNAVLYWTTSKESELVKYEIQKSKDGSIFKTIGEVNGFKEPAAEKNNYTFTDPELLDDLTWYRIKSVKPLVNKYKYSKIITLIGDHAGLKIESLINPFNTRVKFDLISGSEGVVKINILDPYERKLKSAQFMLMKGKTNITISNTDDLPAGVYILQVISNEKKLNRKIIKQYK